jgi:hypothetical protein
MQTDKGKNFSRNRPRSDRSAADYYQTPYGLTQAFIDAHVKKYWKPEVLCDYCSGAGAIVKVLHDNEYTVNFGDITDPLKTDFFTIGKIDPYGIMNPPFRLFNQWVAHCFEVFAKSFALLAPTTYLQGVKRYNTKWYDGIFQQVDYPITHIYTFNRYPMLSAQLRPDGLIETGMQALSWFVWTKYEEAVKGGYGQNTIHRWLDIDRFVFRKGKAIKN